MEKEVHEYMKQCEAEAGTTFTFVVAHHSFINPLVMRRVINRRVSEGLPRCPLYCFVHGTALKMYRWELGPKETDEQKSFPMRFHKMILEEKLFDDQVPSAYIPRAQGEKEPNPGALNLLPGI